jgi:hypothetical protein
MRYGLGHRAIAFRVFKVEILPGHPRSLANHTMPRLRAYQTHLNDLAPLKQRQ